MLSKTSWSGKPRSARDATRGGTRETIATRDKRLERRTSTSTASDRTSNRFYRRRKSADVASAAVHPSFVVDLDAPSVHLGGSAGGARGKESVETLPGYPLLALLLAALAHDLELLHLRGELLLALLHDGLGFLLRACGSRVRVEERVVVVVLGLGAGLVLVGGVGGSSPGMGRLGLTSSSASDSRSGLLLLGPLSSSLEVSALALHFASAGQPARPTRRETGHPCRPCRPWGSRPCIPFPSFVGRRPKARAYTWVSAWKTREARAKPSSVSARRRRRARADYRRARPRDA